MKCEWTCNPKCVHCGDTPSCGDGAWTWAGSHWLHRCRNVDQQCGYDRPMCDKHPTVLQVAEWREMIERLKADVKGLRQIVDKKERGE